MHCPLCGDKLTEVNIKKDKTKNTREEYACTKGCFREDYPLYFHNPFKGIDSKPTDNWSLSWIK